MRLTRLFTPLTLRRCTLRNRIVSTAHSTGLTEGTLIGAALVAYYEARARGGAGLVITGSTSVHPSSSSKLKPALACWDDSVVPAYARLAASVHAAGGAVFVQLNHAGALSGSGGPFGCVVGPSAMDHELAVETARAITPGEMDEVRDAFAAAAARVRASGIDGIEIHGGHGNLIQQFLSPHTNRRTDARGGDMEGRLRYPLEIVRAVRAAARPDMVVGLRLCAAEDYDDGLTLAETCLMAPRLVAAGELDYVSVTSGSDTAWASLPRHYAPMYLPAGHMRGLARAIRETVPVPVLCAGRITDPRDAEAILESGDADLVGMTRALIADRDLPVKARAGDLDGIRYCVGANDGCLGRLFRGQSVTCIQDPTAGREHELPPPEPAARPRRVAVVGAGVAGLEAARVAALRGHAVMVLEAGPEPGGQLRLARRARGREEIGAVADNLLRALERLPVELRLGVTATPEEIGALGPDAVIVATGSTPFLPPGLDDGYDRLVSARAALDGAFMGDPLVVWDTRGDMVGISVADHLAAEGRRVTFATAHESAGHRLDPMTRRLALERLAAHGARMLCNVTATRLTEDGIVATDGVTGAETLLESAATLVAATGARGDDALATALRDAMPTLDLTVVGDARSPRGIESAIAEAHMAARGI